MSELLELCFAGLALGARYALVALGFVIVYRATGVLNFAQVALLTLGAYLAYALGSMIAFALAVVLAMAASALIGAALERAALRQLVGQPLLGATMVTLGLWFVLEEVSPAIWGYDALNLGDPWGIETVQAGQVTLAVRDLWTLGLTFAALGACALLFRYSKLGLAMRAAAIDPESALAVGISPRVAYTASWGIAAALAALAGVTLASGPAALSPGLGTIALVAFPAMIVGGLDSPAGVVLGGLIVGLTQSLTAGYQDELFSWAGDGFSAVMPYAVMLLILMLRPHGLFGTREVRRI